MGLFPIISKGSLLPHQIVSKVTLSERIKISRNLALFFYFRPDYTQEAKSQWWFIVGEPIGASLLRAVSTYSSYLRVIGDSNPFHFQMHPN